MNDNGRAQRESDLISYYSNEIRDRQGRGLSDDRVRTRTSYLRKLDARAASVLELPFEDRTFEAGWTMSTLLHIADEDLDDALAEIVRVLRPGAPLGIGL
ncbi:MULTISPECIES: class I SAM-dependent methyltransferase [unclassified Kribbella]|uniref:class I SAM-dependent methyltransferase n=1 Tax=unclassified Kribbella TaxID=2644121 RepID=UPI003019DF90